MYKEIQLAHTGFLISLMFLSIRMSIIGGVDIHILASYFNIRMCTCILFIITGVLLVIFTAFAICQWCAAWRVISRIGNGINKQWRRDVSKKGNVSN